jgi:hypothetical protein
MKLTEAKRLLLPVLVAALLCNNLNSKGKEKSSADHVSLAEDTSAYTLSNGIISARIDKKSGDLLSMKYRGREMLATVTGPDGLPDTTVDKPGANLRGGGHRYTDHQYGFWSHRP